MLEINVKKRLGQLDLQVDVRISANITAIFGVSGSGKSSLINLVSGLTQPDQGYISLNGKTLVDTTQKINVPVHQRKMGYVFQDGRLFPHYSVKQNLYYGTNGKNAVNFEQILALLDLEHLLNRYPLNLSGGEKQRVAIGRALLSQPDMLLMDEPLSALDLPRKQELLNYLEQLSQQITIPILYVTHNLDELTRLANDVLLLERGKLLLYDKVENAINHQLFSTFKLSV